MARMISDIGDVQVKFKEITRPALSWIFTIALVVFTAKGLVPIEAFIGVAVMAITWWFKSREEEKRGEWSRK